MLGLITSPINSLLFPRVCGSCHSNHVETGSAYACAECWSASELSDGSQIICNKCGVLLGENRRASPVNCWQCDGHQYDKARSLGIYSNAVAAEVVALKSTPVLSRKARTLLESNWASFEIEEVDTIIPVPLSRRRRLERGYNQAEVLANSISDIVGVGIDRNSLARTHHSPLHRIGMDSKARDLSVRNAFEVSRPNLIRGKAVLLVDDVYTTGATVSYCAKELKKAGATKVNVFTLARAVLHN